MSVINATRLWLLRLALVFSIWALGFCQQPTENNVTSKGRIDDLTISCQINPEVRAVEVRLVSHATKRIYIQDQLNADARSNYEAVAFGSDGKALAKAAGLAPSHTGPVVHRISTLIDQFEPRQERIEKFPLSALIDIPRSGGKFRFKIGRALFGEWEDTSIHDRSQMIWCKPIEISLPPIQ